MSRERDVNIIETLKNITLVVLFLFTILLLYFFWEDEPFEKFAQSDDFMQREVMSSDEILWPSRVIICLGGDSYTMEKDAFRSVIRCFREFSTNESLFAEEITEEQYKEHLRYPSAKAVFDYYVPFSVICEVFGVQKITGGDSIAALSEIGYSEISPNSIFVFDKRGGKYYRIAGNDEYAFSDISEVIVNARGNDITYSTLETIFGGQIENQALIPDYLESDIADFEFMQEFASDKDEKTERMAKSFFSNNFDFVRKIEEQSGTVIYMYGFGKIVLIIDKNGTIEYKREETDRPPVAAKYLEALEKALNFIAEHGAFETLDGIAYEPHLKDVVVDPEGKKGYRFIFGISINGQELFYQGSDAVTVDVIGERVSYFKRDLISYNQDQIDSNEGNRKEAFSAMNALAQNLGYINEAMLNENAIGEDNASMTIEELAEMVDMLDCGYARLDDEEERSMVDAAWILTIGNMEFYFGLSDGMPLGYSLK